MNPQKVSSRYFVHLKRAWYAEVTLRETPFVDEVCFGTVPASGAGTYGEMAVRWYRLDHVLAPRLEVFDDGWRLLADFGEILQAMAQVRTGRNVAIAPAASACCCKNVGLSIARRSSARRYCDPGGRRMPSGRIAIAPMDPPGSRGRRRPRCAAGACGCWRTRLRVEYDLAHSRL